MTPDRWQKIDELLDALLEIESGERTAFLNKACAGDDPLRRQLESLLSARGGPDEFSDTLPADAGAALPDPRTAKLVGQSIAHYSVVGSLGAGGMGEVYLARDTKLGRQAALKLLPARFTRDKKRIKRFQQEACAASALNHPNILTVYEIEQRNDLHFIVTEYVEGETLRQRITKSGLKLVEALDLASQVAAALAAAHAAGIVHRDIKPENIMVRPDGLVKVLDFGVAKLTHRPGFPGSQEVSSAASVQTEAGTIVGTIHYMSPEQIRGLDVDLRTDLFSLGVVLYETIAGVRPFNGSTPSDVMVSILEKEPAPLSTAPELDRIVRKALAKSCEERYQTAIELQSDLARLLRETDPEGQRSLACPTCARENPSSFEFCGACGAGLRKSCPNCQRQVAAGNQFCGLCGYQFSASRADVIGPQHHVVPATQPIHASAAERRRATVVCSILSGWADILERLDPEEADRVMGSIKTAVSEAVSRYGGVLDRWSGEEFVALFGVPASYEDDFLRAVHAGLELHSRIRAFSTQIEGQLCTQLGTYTGISSGPVVMRPQEDGKYNVSGDALQIASRLAAHAEVNEILVSPETQRLIAPFFRLQPMTPLALDPKAPAVTIYRVEGKTGVHTRLEAAELAGLTRHVGREKELNLLQSSLESVMAGEGQVVTVIGDAGVGKSRLLLEFRRTLEQRSVGILQSRCQAYGNRIPYLPFVGLLKSLLLVRKEDSPDKMRASAISSIRSIDPNLESYIPLYLNLLSLQSVEDARTSDLKGDDLRLAIREALSAILTLHTRRGPMVIVLEDWQWADEASGEALKRLAALVAAHPLMVVVTCRPEQSLDWAYVENHPVLNLAPLNESASARVIESIIGTDKLPEGLGNLLYRRTGGNPFFIEEVCRTLVEDGRVRVAGGAATMDGSLTELNLPDTVQAVIRTRLDRLDPESQTLLRHASVLGREFKLRVLERLPLTKYEIPTCLEVLQNQGLIQQIGVVPEPVYRFKHMLTQEVAYDSLLLHQRKALHEAAGSAIEELFGDRLEEQLELLTYHYSRAEAWSKAVRFGRESAEKASSLSRFSEALGMLEQTELWLSKLDRTPESVETLINLLLAQERVCETLGMRDRQQELIDRVLSLLDDSSDQALLAEALVRQGELYTLLDRFAEADSALTRSLAIRRALSDSINERVVLRNMGFLYWQQGRYDDAVAFNKTALSLDLEHDDSAGYAKDLTNLGSILRSQGKAGEALEYVEEALQITEELRRPVSHAYTLTIAAHVRRDLGEPERAKEYYRRAIDLTIQHGLPLIQVVPGSALASLCWERGEFEESLELSNELVTLTRRLNLRRPLAEASGVLSQRLLELERPEEALPHLLDAAEIFEQLGDKQEQIKALTSIAYVYERCGSDPAGAVGAWQKAQSLRREQGDAAGELEAFEGMARIARNQQRDAAAALEYLSGALEAARRMGHTAKQGDLLNSMGIIEWGRGNFGAALEKYTEALRIFKTLEDLVHTGLMLNSIGVTLHKLGRTDEAITQLRQAVELHRRSGHRRLESHALAALGEIFTETSLFDQARKCYDGSLDIRRDIGDRKGEGWMLHHIAGVLRSQGEREQGLALLDQATAIAAETGDEQLGQACALLATELEET